MLALLVSLLLVSVDSVMFHLEANARKCLAEEIRQNILVTGEFEVSEAPGQQVSSYQYRGNSDMSVKVKIVQVKLVRVGVSISLSPF